MSLWTLGTNMLRTLLYHTMYYIGSASNGKTETENNFQSIFFSLEII